MLQLFPLSLRSQETLKDSNASNSMPVVQTVSSKSGSVLRHDLVFNVDSVALRHRANALPQGRLTPGTFFDLGNAYLRRSYLYDLDGHPNCV